MEEEDRVLAEDFASPVEIQPGVDQANPDDWQWRQIGSSQPSRATFHLSHSDVNQVSIDVLRPSDCPPDSQFVLNQEIPIIVMDSLDKFWAAESRTWLPLNGVRVPVEGDSPSYHQARERLRGRRGTHHAAGAGVCRLGLRA